MSLNSDQENLLNSDNYFKQYTNKNLIYSNYLDPDLYKMMEIEIEHSSSSNRLIYLVCALATLIFAGIGLSVKNSEIKQATQEFQQQVYLDYSVLTNYY